MILFSSAIEALRADKALDGMRPALQSFERALASVPIVEPSACDFPAIYERWFDDVQRWLAAMGVAEADLDDVTQDLFIIVDRKLEGFDGGNLPGWLYGIARRLAARHRRRSWVKRLFVRRVAAEPSGPLPPTPALLLEQKQGQQIVARALAGMSDKRRRVFVLFEIEGYTGEEIAALENAQLKTIWTRLHHARKDFVRLVSVVAEQEQRR